MNNGTIDEYFIDENDRIHECEIKDIQINLLFLVFNLDIIKMNTNYIFEKYFSFIKILIDSNFNNQQINEYNFETIFIIFCKTATEIELPLLQYWINKGIDVNEISSSNLSPLIASKNLSIIKLLIKNGANIYHIVNNLTILTYQKNIKIDIFEYLIKSFDLINYQNKNGDTALLHYTLEKEKCCSKIYDVYIELLLKNNADITIKNNNGEKFDSFFGNIFRIRNFY